MIKAAIISPCGKYRYLLTRVWEEKKHLSIPVFVMLNPSTADATLDDATVRKCMGFARRWGMGGVNIVNLFAYRSRDPRELAKVEDPIGPDNDYWIGHALGYSELVIVAWGAHGEKYSERVQKVITANRCATKCLTKLRSGHPAHPLMQPYNRQLQYWGPESVVGIT